MQTVHNKTTSGLTVHNNTAPALTIHHNTAPALTIHHNTAPALTIHHNTAIKHLLLTHCPSLANGSLFCMPYTCGAKPSNIPSFTKLRSKWQIHIKQILKFYSHFVKINWYAKDSFIMKCIMQIMIYNYNHWFKLHVLKHRTMLNMNKAQDIL